MVHSGLRCDSIMFDGQVATPQRRNLLYDGQHYHVITNLTGAGDKKYVCHALTEVAGGARSTCDASCDACFAITPASTAMSRSPATSVTDILEKPRASKIIDN